MSNQHQLGSTNSKGLPVLFQGSHKGFLLNDHHFYSLQHELCACPWFLLVPCSSLLCSSSIRPVVNVIAANPSPTSCKQTNHSANHPSIASSLTLTHPLVPLGCRPSCPLQIEQSSQNTPWCSHLVNTIHIHLANSRRPVRAAVSAWTLVAAEQELTPASGAARSSPGTFPVMHCLAHNFFCAAFITVFSKIMW